MNKLDNNENLLRLQQAFKDGVLDVEDVDEDTLDELIELYKKQISNLEQSIDSNKQEIIKIRKKCGF